MLTTTPGKTATEADESEKYQFKAWIKTNEAANANLEIYNWSLYMAPQLPD